MTREACCEDLTPGIHANGETGPTCEEWHRWSTNWWAAYAIFMGWAMLFGLIAGSVTLLTKKSLPAAAPGLGDKMLDTDMENLKQQSPTATGKSLYMAAGSGIPEIKTHLSGFVIPHFLDFKVLVVKAIGASFAVPTGMCLGKEGPFVHISACVCHFVASRFPRYANNGRKMREILAAGVAAGLTVAFGAPIGGVLFAYEEIATHFPRKVLWRAFLCSAFAAMILKELNPTGTGKLVLFETDYGTQYLVQHYVLFVLIGVAGGVWGGIFCKMNFKWSKWFRSYSIIKNNPVLEVLLVVFVTVALQYPNPLTREDGDKIIKNLLADCGDDRSQSAWVCEHENSQGQSWAYVGWLVYGCLVKLVLTIVTFGAKVPSGIIIPAMDAGSLFGRLVGQFVTTISPGIFAMVGAGAFLAGVSRMTISLCVILFELTGELDYIVPHMVAILTAKWVADSLSSEGVYDLAQTVLGHPFLDPEHSLQIVQQQRPAHLVEQLIPPKQTMEEITVIVEADGKVARTTLETKLERLKQRGLMDAGLVLVQNGIAQGYLAEGELEFGLQRLGQLFPADTRVRLMTEMIEPENGITAEEEGRDEEDAPLARVVSLPLEMDFSSFVDRTPLALCAASPMEYAVEMFGKLGVRHLLVTEERTGKLVGVIIKKRMVKYLEELH